VNSSKLPNIEALRSRGLLVPVIIGTVAALLLLHGALYVEPPRDSPAPPSPTPPPMTLPKLRPSLEKTPLSYWADYWAQLGERARDKVALIGRQRLPGVLVAPGLALTSILAADSRRHQDALREAGRSDAGADPPPEPSRLISLDARLGVALFELGDPNLGAFTLADLSAVRPGDLVAAVTLSGEGQVRLHPGYVVAVGASGSVRPEDETLEVSLASPPGPVAALIDLDGELLGVAIQSEGGVRYIASNALLHLLGRLQGDPPCHAIEVAGLAAGVRDLLGIEEGVVVEWVDPKAFVPEPSVRAGDVLMAWAGQSVTNVWTFHQLYEAQESGALVRFQAIRGERRIAGATRMPDRDCRPVQDPALIYPDLGLELVWAERIGERWAGAEGGFRVVAVAPSSPAAGAGLQRDDLIVAAGQKPVDRHATQAFELFEQEPSPLLLTVLRGDRVRLVAVSPGADG
jgi:S1-C subfamily serine protease